MKYVAGLRQVYGICSVWSVIKLVEITIRRKNHILMEEFEAAFERYVEENGVPEGVNAFYRETWSDQVDENTRVCKVYFLFVKDFLSESHGAVSRSFAVVLVQSSNEFGQNIISSLSKKLMKSRVPCSSILSHPAAFIRQHINSWFEANPEKLGKIIVISDRKTESNIIDAVAEMPNVEVWTFDGLQNQVIKDDCFRYFPDVYPEEMTEKDGIKRILAVIDDKYLGKEFFQKLEDILAA
jgi:hypothetical protein